MPNISTKITSPTDKDIITGFIKIWEKLGKPKEANYNIRIGSDREPIQLNGNISDILSDESVKLINSVGSSVIHSAGLSFASLSVSISISRGDTYDTISVNERSGNNTVESIKAITTIRSIFKKFEVTGSLNKILGSEIADFYSSREEALVRLESLNEDLISDTHKYRISLDKKIKEERSQLKDEFQKEKEELLKQLKEKETLLEQREEELDDRSNTHARRKLREDLKSILKQRNTTFNLTSETQKKRRPIHILFMILVTVLLGITIFNIYISSSDPSYWTNIKTSLGILSLAGAIGFYIKWSDIWARQHADEEFKLRQLELDVDRASWLVEMALEWKAERGTEIPRELVDRLSRGLFIKGELKNLNHPTQDLAASLVGASAALKIDVPGLGQLQLDRRGLNKFKKAIDDKDENESL